MYKVLYLIDSLQTGGAEKSLATIASRIKRVRPVFVYVYDGNLLENILKEHGVEVYPLNIKREYNFKKAVEKLLPLVIKINPDIIHSTLFNSDIIARKLKKRYPVILINSFVNNSYLKERYKKLSWLNKVKLFAFQQYDRFSASNVDLFISNSEAIKVSNASALKIPLEKIKVIHRGRDISIYEDVEISQLYNLRSELNLANETILLNVGRLLERKGQMDLLIAFNDLIKSTNNLKLLIAGKGPYETALREYISANGLDEKVHLLGNRADIPQLLKLADVFVFPSWFEGLPGSLIEAMMAGVPIIASDIPENLECVTEESALIFKKGNSVSLQQKISWALENREKMLEKAEKGKTVARNKFDINLIVQEYETTYLNLIKNNSILQSKSTF